MHDDNKAPLSHSTESAAPPPRVVIDTQVVMDWLVFAEPSVEPLVEAVRQERLHWIGTSAMQAELHHVLARGVAAAYAPDLKRIDATFERYCRSFSDSPARVIRLLCRDTDDQMFIDLAVACGARWLISRDRAVLALAKRARAFGLCILTPQAWSRDQPDQLA